MTTQLTTPNNNLPDISKMNWSDSGADHSDLLVSKIVLVQSNNPLVLQKKAQPGDIIESIDGKALAHEGKPIEFIPLVSYKNWRRYKMEGPKKDKQVYLDTVPFNSQNAAWEKFADSGNLKNVKCLNFFVTLPKSDFILPLVLTFRGGSTLAGRKVSSQVLLNAMQNKPPFASVFSLSTKLTSFDGNTFYCYEATKSREASKEEMAEAFKWWEKLSTAQKKGAVEVDESTDEGVPF